MMSNLFSELSPEQQELLTGGQCCGRGQFSGMQTFQGGSRPDIIVNGDLTDTSNGRTFPVRILGFLSQ
ncbi:hypothetical protein [Halotia branconii]|uniref:Uncharacterized protein n=1 Tax=Halotia branconii CENA392 TaxID=1539056 RepID=A0AAJ6NQH2_9CYAN|nr:hypothetical protein [Halotia branconii]WGV24666.1 hypothetical protein QI031_23290 [Halotia branconii CENA392]